MSDFTTSIQNISNIYGVAPVHTPKQIQQIATIIKNGTIDSVNFSDESKNLFQISEINGRFDDLLGVPSTLTTSQQSQLEKLGSIAENLFSSGSLKPASTDFEAILENFTKLYEGKELDAQTEEKLVKLTGELQSYVQNLSISQLYSSSASVSSTNTLFNERLTDSEKGDLGKIAQQLNRVLFTPTDNEGSSFLDSLNSLYGLNTPSSEESDDIFSLFSQRNSLLTSVLLNRNLASNYGDLL